MKKHQLTAFYLEALLLVAAFVAMILVLTGVFGAARAQSTQAQRLTQAVTLAANAAEALSAAEDLEGAAALLDEGGNARLMDGQLEAAYQADGSPCADGAAALRLTVRYGPSAEEPALMTGRIDVFVREEQTPLYTLETASFRKEVEP